VLLGKGYDPDILCVDWPMVFGDADDAMFPMHSGIDDVHKGHIPDIRHSDWPICGLTSEQWLRP
jgi:hypothetical protein